MAINKLVDDVEKYLKWSVTTQQEYQEFVRNIYSVISDLVDSTKMWQPGETYNIGTVIKSSSMQNNTKARVTVRGVTGAAEPTWGAVGDTITDGTVKYIIVKDTIDFATDAEVAEGTNTNKIVNAARLKKALTDGLAPKLDTKDLTNILLYSVLHSLSTNYVPSDVSNNGWNKLGLFISSYNKSVLKNQPTQYGQLINIPYDRGAESTQIWLDQSSGRIRYRGGNGNNAVNEMPFSTFPTQDEFNSESNALRNLISQAAASGGVIAGNVSNPNAWWIKIGGTIPLIIQGGKYLSLNYSGNGELNTCTLPISFSKPLFATAISTSTDDNIIPHIYAMSSRVVTVCMDQVSNGIRKPDIFLLAIGTA